MKRIYQNIKSRAGTVCRWSARLSAIALTAALVSFGPGNSNCASDAFLDKCASSLGGFTFIKSINVETGKGDKNEFSYVFSKGSTYLIVVCDQNIKGQRMIVNLYDRNRKLIASSYNKSSKKYYSTLNYPCTATGVYYIESYFEGDKGGCGVNILGFNK